MKAPIFRKVLLVGVNYRTSSEKLVAACVTRGDRVELVREPFNPHDKAAVMAVFDNSLIAYVQRDVASELATWMDQGWGYYANVRHNLKSRMIVDIVPINPKASNLEVMFEMELNGEMR